MKPVRKKSGKQSSSRGVALVFVLFLTISVSMIVLSGFIKEPYYHAEITKAVRRVEAKGIAEALAIRGEKLLRAHAAYPDPINKPTEIGPGGIGGTIEMNPGIVPSLWPVPVGGDRSFSRRLRDELGDWTWQLVFPLNTTNTCVLDGTLWWMGDMLTDGANNMVNQPLTFTAQDHGAGAANRKYDLTIVIKHRSTDPGFAGSGQRLAWAFKLVFPNPTDNSFKITGQRYCPTVTQRGVDPADPCP